ncbi:MAG: hypothetical protein R3E31_10710 [Chloroflexota bacterium]
MKKEDRSYEVVRRGGIEAALLLCLALFLFTGVLFAQAQNAEATAVSPQQADNATLLAVYILAFDNDREADDSINLTYKYTPTVQSLVAATDELAQVTAVILADLDQADDTHILVAHNGETTAILGLPNANGSLNPTLNEYDTTDGLTLGGFLLWAQQNYPATQTIVSYIGHGTPLAPDTSPDIASITTDTNAALNRISEAIPMPSRVGMNPNFTDHHVPDSDQPSLLTAYDLALALDIATDGGANKIAVLDMLHCFAASIEQLTEVAPYAVTAVAAPNYAFFDPPMLGAALADLELSMSPVEMANSIATSYSAVIPPYKHPNVLVAVDNSKLPAIKQKWDDVAAGLLASFANNPGETAVALLNAYTASASTASLYDTTFCSEHSDYQLAPPDALADMGGFALALSQQFMSLAPDVAQAALDTQQAINNAVTLKINQNGLPWWDPQPDSWNFNGVSGIAIFAPLQPMAVNGELYHPWQSLWYTDTLVIAEDVLIGSTQVDVLNPHPYQFIGGSEPTWADVIDAYWTQRGIHPRQGTATALCLPEIKEVEDEDLALVVIDSVDPVQAGWPLSYQLRVINKTTIAMPNVILTATLPEETLFLGMTPAAACQRQANIITCQLGNFSAHQETAVTIDLRVGNRSGDMPFPAQVTSDKAEIRWQNNLNTEHTAVLPSTFLYIPILEMP